MTATAIPILRITGTTPPGHDLPTDFRGAVLDRLVSVPAKLAG